MSQIFAGRVRLADIINIVVIGNMNLLKGALLSRKTPSMYFILWIIHSNIIRCYKSSLQAEFRSLIHSLLNNITTLN